MEIFLEDYFYRMIEHSELVTKDSMEFLYLVMLDLNKYEHGESIDKDI